MEDGKEMKKNSLLHPQMQHTLLCNSVTNTVDAQLARLSVQAVGCPTFSAAVCAERSCKTCLCLSLSSWSSAANWLSLLGWPRAGLSWETWPA